MDFNWQYPFYIEAMTGGSEKTGEINQQLAVAARETGLAMAVGSESICAIKEPAQATSLQIAREVNPDGFLMANIGAGHSAANAQRAVDLIHADALEVHVNAAQETVMPEGDESFYWKDNIKEIVEYVKVPVIVKEVGFGMDAQSINELAEMGVQYVNIGGHSVAPISHRLKTAVIEKPQEQYAFLYDWGQTTAESLLGGPECN